MTAVGRVEGLWRYPVKSMRGERLDAADLDEGGVAGDRLWAVLDPAGTVLSARRVPRLLEARAHLEDGTALIAVPSGEVVQAGGADADRALSAWLGREVRLARPASTRPEIADEEGSFRGRAGTFFDAAPLHLLTTATLAHLAGLSDGVFDARRFRPNILIAADGADPVEQTWTGRPLEAGSARLKVAGGVGRCVITTLAQDELPHDRGILRTVARALDNVAGVYAIVEEPGRISLGDEVRLG